jgi:hypothetical protein
VNSLDHSFIYLLDNNGKRRRRKKLIKRKIIITCTPHSPGPYRH